MFGLSQPYTGHFFDAEYLEFDENTKQYKIPVKIRVKPYDISSQGVSASTKQTVLTQSMNGRPVEKSTFTVQVVEYHKYKTTDKVRIINEDKKYTILKIGEGFDSINAIANLMFPNMKSNKPTILYLGDK